MSPPSIAYEKQHTAFSCGAAALAMVYRALGRPAGQEEIWSAVGRQEGAGRWASPTYLLCQHALARGLASLIIRARPPGIALLQQCRQHGLHVILQHRIRSELRRGHFSVLVNCSPDQVTLHDPQQGPDRLYPFADFQVLWARQHCGHISVVLAEPGQAAPPCAVCGKPLPIEKPCPRCGHVIRFEPGAALGCGDRSCGGALWSAVFCPQCDHRLNDLI